MKFFFFLAIFSITSGSSFSQQPKTFGATDVAALKSLAGKWELYWNNHTMDSMSTMLREDVDFVNVAGVWLKGKTAAVNDHQQKHEGIVFKNSVWTTDSVAIKYVKPDLAILHIGWGLSGDNDPDGTPRKPRHGLFTWVVMKEKKQWQLLAVHNVNIREPMATAK